MRDTGLLLSGFLLFTKSVFRRVSSTSSLTVRVIDLGRTLKIKESIELVGRVSSSLDPFSKTTAVIDQTLASVTCWLLPSRLLKVRYQDLAGRSWIEILHLFKLLLPRVGRTSTSCFPTCCNVANPLCGFSTKNGYFDCSSWELECLYSFDPFRSDFIAYLE